MIDDCVNELLQDINLLSKKHFNENKKYYMDVAKAMTFDEAIKLLEVYGNCTDSFSTQWLKIFLKGKLNQNLENIQRKIKQKYEIELLFGKQKESSLNELPSYILRS